MSDDDLRAKAAFALAKRALDDATLSDEQRAKKDALAKRKRTKRIVQVAIGGLVVVGLIGLMLHYWYWSLLLGLVGAAALYGRHRWRARRALKKKPDAVAALEAPAAKVRVEPEAAPAEDLDASIDEDLAELKARLKK